MNSSLRSLLTLAFTLCAGAFGISAAHASFAIMPMETQLKMPQDGNSITDEIEVFNGGDTPLHISSSVVDWKLTPDGDYQYAEAGTEKSSCAKWIQLSPPEFNVAPKKSVRVRYSITPTETLTDERRAMIFFASRPIPVKGENRMGLSVATRMGCKVFVSPAQPLTKNGVLSDMELQNAPRQRVRVSVKNPGAATFRAGGTVQISDEAGTIVAQGVLNSAQVVPQAERNLWFNLSAPLPAGNYIIKAVVDYGAKQNIGGELKTKVTTAPMVSAAIAPAKG
ncbi:P pilus assembly protein, chaperone PapD [Abditibacterium utsteinense]|uniref:P pilus assembly protein, chaperone PapD n=1 Tax=Abditibacterium utsteinense TaxID=1960156 RepID=A0A2S8SQ66_9BACT|nr:fimbria/pilus periplasmic chaperone [Abditibacterium utsteinense]PQV62909.1 P pilus assembly protein, chaperone PapD [Abditibacterium utsteinense]